MCKYKGTVCIIVAIILCGAFIYKSQANTIENFETYGDYIKNKKLLLSDSYETPNEPSITANNSSDIHQNKPIFLARSNNNNNIRYWKQPSNGTCSRSEFCGNFYSETKHTIPLDPQQPGFSKNRVNYYDSSDKLCG